MSNSDTSAEEHRALKAAIVASRLIIGVGLTFLFVQLVADIIAATLVCRARVCGPFGSYSVGLVILMIGAVLLVVAIIGARPRLAAPAQERGISSATGTTLWEGEPSRVSAPTKISLNIESGSSSARVETQKAIDEPS
jgi:hypothetical protein